MPYIIRDQKIEYVQLGSAEMMAATNCYMTEREARRKIDEDNPLSEAMLRVKALNQVNQAEAEKREKAERLRRAESQFKLRLSAGTVPLDEMMEVWRKAYLS